MSGNRFGVLFVCTGNICRSPTAEAVFRRPQAEIDDELRAALQRGGSARSLLRWAARVRARARHARRRRAGLAGIPATTGTRRVIKPSGSGTRARFPPEPTAHRDRAEAAGAPAWPA